MNWFMKILDKITNPDNLLRESAEYKDFEHVLPKDSKETVASMIKGGKSQQHETYNNKQEKVYYKVLRPSYYGLRGARFEYGVCVTQIIGGNCWRFHPPGGFLHDLYPETIKIVNGLEYCEMAEDNLPLETRYKAPKGAVLATKEEYEGSLK